MSVNGVNPSRGLVNPVSGYEPEHYDKPEDRRADVPPAPSLAPLGQGSSSSSRRPISFGDTGNSDSKSMAYNAAPQNNAASASAGNNQITFGHSQPNIPGSSASINVDLNKPFNDGNVQIELYSKGGDGHQGGPREEYLGISTGEGADNVRVSNLPGGGVNLEVNGVSYDIPWQRDERSKQELHVETGGGNDSVSIDADMTRTAVVDAGEGNDTVKAGGGSTRVFGGAGNDDIQLGSGQGYAEGNDGADRITGGTGNSVMYGGNGNDLLCAGDGPADKGTYMDGGDGDDQLYGGSGHNIMNGGKGDDFIDGGRDRNTIYSGKGTDTANAPSDSDLIYAKDTDRVWRGGNSRLEHVTPSDAGGKGFQVEGDKEFKQRVEDDMELLRSSPVGQQMLSKMDEADAPVTIQEGNNGDFYSYRRRELEFESPEERERQDAAHGFVEGGQPGQPAENSVLTYDRAFNQEVYNRPPVNTLYHEMAHAYNGATGTFAAGDTYVGPDANDPGRPHYEPNLERQAVGLPIDGQPYDYDGNPFTPPTDTNPSPFNENALYREMGRPLRERYLDV